MLVLMTCTTMSTVVQGQTIPPPFGPPTDDPEIVPIDSWIPFVFLSAIVVGFYQFRASLRLNKSNN
ncbi:hypothetical protein [Flavobacterium sp. SM2513]|uniref:hypothetical protein n=1 Tax=Flavobacterium sp. SM2513 TaxID=3424766 RepID=UPI003D7FC7D9